MKKVAIRTPDIRLAQFLKWSGLADTGGQARDLVSRGLVQVNGQTELHSGRRLVPGDRVGVGTAESVVLVPADGEA